MNKTLIALFASLIVLAAPARAEENPAVVDALSGYMDFAEYGSSLIWPEQIPADDWKKVFIVDARDAAQYAKEHIPGAVNIEWRQAVARRAELPKRPYGGGVLQLRFAVRAGGVRASFVGLRQRQGAAGRVRRLESQGRLRGLRACRQGDPELTLN